MQLQTKTRILKAGVIVAGACGIFLFLAIRIPALALRLLDPHEYYTGRDLYKESFVDYFRESHPAFDSVTNEPPSYQHSDRNPPVNEADLLTFGDSFFNFRYIPTFPEKLSDATGRRIYFRRHHNPFTTLRKENYTSDVTRVILYEIGERGIYKKFIRSPFIEGPKGRPEKPAMFEILNPGEAEQRYTVLLQQSRFSNRAYRWLATKKFEWFGYMSPMTPVYSLDPPFLFYKATVDDSPYSFHYRHSDEEIAKICDHVRIMRDALRERHQLEMVFLPVPSKISIHSELVYGDQPYNNFLPRIYEGLRERGVHVIDLYHPFNAQSNLLYFASDTHWNDDGIDLAVRATLEYLQTNRLFVPEAP